jgi:glycosyltransferase involved in cell wall biosynthesis
MPPRVSVICLCYNHARFVREALQSVLDQTYAPIELIVIDDGSSDGSQEVIAAFVTQHPQIIFLPSATNQGNCRAFNSGLQKATGAYVIDLAADDRLVPIRVERAVALIHSDRFPHNTIPQGKIFRDILSRYFINSPTMMIRKSLLDALGGYDETLAYEDFDFWVRSSPRTHYLYIPEPLVQRRVLITSMGKQQYARKSAQQRSTFRVCEKALALCADAEDFAALKKRVRYELRKSLQVGAFGLAWDYIKLWRKIP